MTNRNQELKSLAEYAVFIAKESGKIIRKHYLQPLRVEHKTDHSPVTIADKQAEEFMRESIMKQFPDHGIIGEEFGTYQEAAKYQWVLDPIDGTKSFIHGVPLFGTLIAVVRGGQPVLGFIHLPVQGHMMIGDNNSTTLDGIKVSVGTSHRLEDALLLTTDQVDITKHRSAAGFDKLVRQVRLYRTWGDCFGYFLLAQGKADIMIDAIMSIWDMMAVIPVIRGAGGVVSDYYGNDPVQGNSLVTSTPHLHPQVISCLNP